MRFEQEEVKVVALGSAWVAAVTSRNFLRIFTKGGLQVSQMLTSSYCSKFSLMNSLMSIM